MATLNRDVQAADSGEFQIAAITLGIPHPPGYPLFTMIGWLFAQMPIGTPFMRVSMLSVVASALTLVLVAMAVWQLGERPSWAEQAKRPGQDNKVSKDNKVYKGDKDINGSEEASGAPWTGLTTGLADVSRLLGGLAAALALATSTTFWAQATTTNIRSLTALFTASMLLFSARAWRRRQPSSLVLFALAFGLGVAHHVSLIFIGLGLGSASVVWLWRANRRALGRALIVSILVIAATQLVWLYLPIRDAAGARFAPGNLNTPAGLAFHIFARGFAGDMLAFAAPEFLTDRLALLPTLLEFQFGGPLLALMALAGALLIVRARWLGAVWFAAFAAHLFITITYRAPQTVEYALPCWVILCAALGGGIGAFGSDMPVAKDSAQRRGWTLLVAAPGMASVVCGLLVVVFAARDGLMRLPSFVALAADHTVRGRAERVLRIASPHSTVLAQWHQASPMWALQDVEGLQKGVHVDYVYPRGAEPYAVTFARQAKDSAARGPVVVTGLFAREFEAHDVRTAPLPDTPAWQVATEVRPPEPITPSLTFDGRIVVNQPPGLDGAEIETGQSLPIDLGWYRRSARIDGDSITVRILRPDGRLAANADIALEPGEVLQTAYVQRVILGIPLDLMPGRYDVLMGAYRSSGGHIDPYTSANGHPFERIATVTVAAATQPPATQRPLDADADPTEPQLIGLDYDTGIAGQVRVWTHWRLGTTAREISLLGADGKPLAAPKQLPAKASASASQRYLSLGIDIPPMRDIWIGFSHQRLSAYVDGERYVPFGDQMALIASSSQRNGSALKADLVWLAARPIVDDYIVSVRVAGGPVYLSHDGVPALGDLPTLKWIRGSRVLDRHPFELGGYQGALKGSVVVYDSVTQLPLPPLDERYTDGVTLSIR